jgi:hypothetical protein
MFNTVERTQHLSFHLLFVGKGELVLNTYRGEIVLVCTRKNLTTFQQVVFLTSCVQLVNKL